MTNSKLKKYLSIGIRISAFLLIILFFVPSICVSCSDVEVNFSAYEAAIGDAEEDAAKWYDCILFVMLLFPVAILLISNRKPIITAIMSTLNIVSMVVFIVAVRLRCDAYFEEMEEMFTVKPKFSFFVNILISLLIIGTVLFERQIVEKFSVPDKREEETLCTTCGSPVKSSDQFCVKCGAQLETTISDNQAQN